MDKLVEFKWTKYGRSAFHGKLASSVAFAALLCIMTVADHGNDPLHAFAHKAFRVLAAWLYLPDLWALGGDAPRGACREACVAVLRTAGDGLRLVGRIARDAFAAPAAAAPATTAAASAAPTAREALHEDFYRLLAAPVVAGWEQVAPPAVRSPTPQNRAVRLRSGHWHHCRSVCTCACTQPRPRPHLHANALALLHHQQTRHRDADKR